MVSFGEDPGSPAPCLSRLCPQGRFDVPATLPISSGAWAILQDLHQLKSAYGERAGMFLVTAGVIQVFDVADIDTATWVSRSIGR